MNRSGLLLLLIAVIVAGGITWLNSYWLTYQDFQFTRNEKKIDYYLSDFTLLNTQSDGQMRYKIKGRHLVHQQSNGSSEIFNPLVQAQDQDGTLLLMRADKAQQLVKNGDIQLLGNVSVIKYSKDTKENFQLTTKDLNYNPLERILSSSSQLLLHSNNGTISGRGFSTNLAKEELRILSDVHIKFEMESEDSEAENENETH